MCHIHLGASGYYRPDHKIDDRPQISVVDKWNGRMGVKDGASLIAAQQLRDNAAEYIIRQITIFIVWPATQKNKPLELMKLGVFIRPPAKKGALELSPFK